MPHNVYLYKKNLGLNNLAPDQVIKTNIIHALYMREFYTDFYFQIITDNDYIVMNNTPASMIFPLEFIDEIKPTSTQIDEAESSFKFSTDDKYYNRQKYIFQTIRRILN